MEFKGNDGTEIRMSPGFLSEMTRGFRQRERAGEMVKGVREGKRTVLAVRNKLFLVVLQSSLPHCERSGSLEK